MGPGHLNYAFVLPRFLAKLGSEPGTGAQLAWPSPDALNGCGRGLRTTGWSLSRLSREGGSVAEKSGEAWVPGQA